MISRQKLLTTLKLDYTTAFKQFVSQSMVGDIMKKETVNRKRFNLFDFGDVSKTEKTTGPISLKTIGEFEMPVAVDKYASGYRFDEDELTVDEVAPQLRTAIRGAGEEQAGSVADLFITDILPDLINTDTLDGQKYYSTSHPVKGGTQSNKLTGVAIADIDNPTLAEAAKIFDTLWRNVKGLKSDTGRFRNAGANKYKLFVPLEWELVFRALFEQTTQILATLGGTASESNIHPVFAVSVIGTPDIAISGTPDAEIYLFASGPGMRPPLLLASYVPNKMKEALDIESDSIIFIFTASWGIFPNDYTTSNTLTVTETP